MAQLSGILSNGGLIKTGAGTLILSATNSYTGGTTISQGTLQLGDGTTTGTVLNAIVNNGTLAFNAAQFETPTFSNNISGSGGVSKVGQGTITLSGNSSYNGPTTIAGGRLSSSSTNGISPNSNIVFAGGLLATSSLSYTTAIGTGAGQIQWVGSGGITNNVGGTLTVNLHGDGRQLVWNVNNFVPFGSALKFAEGNINGVSSANTVFVNPIDLNGGVGTFDVADNGFVGTVTMNGAISNGSLVKTGDGYLALGTTNTYAGGTTISAGILHASEGTTLPNTGNLTLNGGILETTGGTFTRSLGTGSGQLQWLSGGFSAQGADLTVNIGGAGAQLVWGTTADFITGTNTISFGSQLGDHGVVLINPIDLGGIARTFSVRASGGSVFDYAEMRGEISNGSLRLNGNGTLILSAANSYTGATTLDTGSLRAQDGVGLPTASPLVFNGGVLEMHGTFDRALGTGVDQVRWSGQGGFAAQGGDLTVNIGGAGQTLVWGSTPNFLHTADELFLGSPGSSYKTTFVNPIDLNGAQHTIHVYGSASDTNDSIELTGVISNGIVNFYAGSSYDNLGPTGKARLIVLSAPNTYSTLRIDTLAEVRATEGIGLPTTANLSIAGGLYETSGSFTRPLGTGAGEVQWINGTGGGGFAAYGGELAINLFGDGRQVVFGQNSFSLTLLNTYHADSRVVFTNPIDMNAQTLTIDAGDNPFLMTDYAELAGVLSNGNLRITGLGLLVVSANNNYTGTTTLSNGNGGVMRARDGIGLPTASRLILSGVFESDGVASFTRSLGTAAGNVSWSGSGGFSAHGTDLSVDLGGLGAEVVWAQSSFVPTARNLVLNSKFADAKTTFVNPINFNGAVRSIQVNENTFASTDLAEVSGKLTNGGLNKIGAGTLRITAANDYALGTTIAAGTIQAANNSALGVGAVVVAAGARLDIAAGIAVANDVTLQSGVLSGRGTLTTPLTLTAGSTISPGGSADGTTDVGVGTLTVQSITWQAGSTFRLQMISAESVTGTGWDYLTVLSTLMFQDTTADKYKLSLSSLNTSGAAGELSDFDSHKDYSWLFATASGGITGFDELKFEVDTTDFANSLSGSFYVTRVDNDLMLNYSAVPEPSSLTLIAVGGAGGWYYRRKKRRLETARS